MKTCLCFYSGLRIVYSQTSEETRATPSMKSTLIGLGWSSHNSVSSPFVRSQGRMMLLRMLHLQSGASLTPLAIFISFPNSREGTVFQHLATNTGLTMLSPVKMVCFSFVKKQARCAPNKNSDLKMSTAPDI